MEQATGPSSEARSIIELCDFTVRYGSLTAVDRASFSVPQGACGLLGKNGAGKSSILKAVLGLIRPASGQATVLGLDARTEGLELRDMVGYMPEREASFPGLTGLEAVLLAGQLSGLPRVKARQRAHEVLFLVSIDEERYRPIKTYPSGMKQKIKLAIALVHDPMLLFLDEPTNGLDPDGRREILEILAGLVRDKGKSLILSSHILPDVEDLCSHVVLMDKGRVLEQGPIGAMTEGTGRSYRVSVVGDRPHFVESLRELGILHEQSENGWLVLVLPEADKPDRIFRLAKAASCQIRQLELERKTLLDVFLHSVAASEPGAGDTPQALAEQGGD